jgi:uncharacterized phage-associated protein
MPSTLNIPAAVRKSTQALNYFARLSASGSPRAEINKMKALKLLFFADRFHLRKYGRTVSNCAYFAMARGPVASEAKNVAEESSRLPSSSRAYSRRYVRRKDAYSYSSAAKVDTAVLSRTDMEALDFAWKTFGHYTEFELVEITHHYPEWRRQAAKLRHDGHRRVEMDYSDFFADPGGGYNACHDLSVGERKIALELFTDQQSFDQRWS